MGRDKANLEVDGLPLLERTAALAKAVGLPVLIVGRSRPADWPLDAVPFVEDAQPGRGPLGGLHMALTQVKGPVLVIACDMPRLSADALRWLIAEGQSERAGEYGLVVVNSGQWEPLFSVYTPKCLALIEERMQQGRLSLHGLIEAGRFGMAEAPPWIEPLLLNVNTPEELRGIS
jgi:molybdopterin-guanine dinucleotide biosynthesis protein A